MSLNFSSIEAPGTLIMPNLTAFLRLCLGSAANNGSGTDAAMPATNVVARN